MNLFNFHTHNIDEKNGIINCFPEGPFPSDKMLSCGLHPWHYSNNFKEAIGGISELAESGKIVAVGETGFDPKSPVSLEIQKEIFLEHLFISEKYQLPIIVHCVKNFNVLIDVVKTHKPAQAMIIHGFNGKISFVCELVKNGFYFSVSENILKNPDKAKIFFSFVPSDRIFFETDDLHGDISNIYNFAAGYMNTSLTELSKIVEDNLKRIGL
jgi:TatD DNase family protein